MGFAEWIGEVVKIGGAGQEHDGRRSDGFRRFRQRAGRSRLASARVRSAVGEIATPRLAAGVFVQREGIAATVFLELLGLDRRESGAAAGRWRRSICAGRARRGACEAGLSPHAPYTVSPSARAKACRALGGRAMPVAMHLAESRRNWNCSQSQTGPLVELLNSLGAWQPEVVRSGLRPLDYLQMLATAHRALVIHGNYLVRTKSSFVAAHRDRLSLVYCPRTHAYFGHEPYPLAKMLAAGVRWPSARIRGPAIRTCGCWKSCGTSRSIIRRFRRRRSCGWGRWRGRRRWDWRSEYGQY